MARKPKKKKALKPAKHPWVLQDYVTIVRDPLGAYSSTEGPKQERDGEEETHHYAGLFDIATVTIDKEYVIVTEESLVALIERLQRAEELAADFEVSK